MSIRDLFTSRTERAPECKALDEPRRPRFCTTCGSRLVTRTTSIGFDRFNGDERLHSWLSCPNTTRQPRFVGTAFGSFYDESVIDCTPKRKPTRRSR
jgi:hypothetical protein